jgi:hypothetical protein
MGSSTAQMQETPEAFPQTGRFKDPNRSSTGPPFAREEKHAVEKPGVIQRTRAPERPLQTSAVLPMSHPPGFASG